MTPSLNPFPSERPTNRRARRGAREVRLTHAP